MQKGLLVLQLVMDVVGIATFYRRAIAPRAA